MIICLSACLLKVNSWIQNTLILHLLLSQVSKITQAMIWECSNYFWLHDLRNCSICEIGCFKLPSLFWTHSFVYFFIHSARHNPISALEMVEL